MFFYLCINVYLPSRFTFLPLICSNIILDTSGSLKLSMHPLCRLLSSFHFATGHLLQRVFVQNSPICRIVSSLFVMCAISLLHFFQLGFGFLTGKEYRFINFANAAMFSYAFTYVVRLITAILAKSSNTHSRPITFVFSATILDGITLFLCCTLCICPPSF